MGERRKTILLTGASRGIGHATVKRFSDSGWRVLTSSREAVPAECKRDPNWTHHVTADLSQPQAVEGFIGAVREALGDEPLDALVNNAGLRRESLLALTPDRDWDDIMDVNLDGVFRCCRAVLPLMMHRRRGSIVNISSLSAVCGVAGQTAYAASKAALLGMTRALAREVGKRGVRVNAVLPGFVPTDMTASLPEDVVRALRSHECLPRGTSAADVANLAMFLTSERAAAITGQALIIDSGISA